MLFTGYAVFLASCKKRLWLQPIVSKILSNGTQFKPKLHFSLVSMSLFLHVELHVFPFPLLFMANCPVLHWQGMLQIGHNKINEISMLMKYLE